MVPIFISPPPGLLDYDIERNIGQERDVGGGEPLQEQGSSAPRSYDQGNGNILDFCRAIQAINYGWIFSQVSKGIFSGLISQFYNLIW